MNISEKLQVIAENQELVYQAGYDKGIAAGCGGGGEVSDDYVVEINPPNTIKTYTDNFSCIIPDNQFKGFTELTTITAPYVAKIGKHAFDGCGKLTDIDVNLLGDIGDYAFNNCYVLGPRFIIGSISELGIGAFTNCTNLEMIQMNIQNLADKLFSGCTKLKAIIDRTESSALPLQHPSAFEGTPIANGTGYIYVASKHFADFQADDSWAPYINQFRILEDYTVDGTVDGELDETKI